MEVPLKSKPKVSMARHLDPSAFTLSARTPVPFLRLPTLPDLTTAEDVLEPVNYKLTRTYSETETNNFDADTGHRLYDDGKIRPKQSRASSPIRPDYYQTNASYSQRQKSSSRLYTRSHNSLIDSDTAPIPGLEDEYIPGLDFATVIQDWNCQSSGTSTPTSWEAASYLDLNALHAKVAPKPIHFKQPKFSKGHTFTLGCESAEDPKKKKRKGSSKDSDPNAPASYEAVLASLPSNFNEFPYSQRKKLVKQISESIDYSQFSAFAKNYYAERLSSALSARTQRSDPASLINNGSFLRRSRRNSTNTVAGRLLAMYLSLDLKQLEALPKKNVDEKGAIVLEHQLGKVIGFGAWGIIRECTAKDGTIRAVKIVKSTKELERSKKLHNPRVLQVFRNEIEIWKRLNHPNILRLIESVEADEIIFCLTDRISGGTLFDIVSRWGVFNEGIKNTSGPLAFSIGSQKKRLLTTANFTSQIIKGLVYMHEELGIVHGDLKLENILIDNLDRENLKMILCDFGMSRVYTSRINRRLANLEDSAAMSRSRSSYATVRRPYNGPDSVNTKSLFADDCKIGIQQLLRTHGPSINSVQLSPSVSSSSLAQFHEFKTKDNRISDDVDPDLPHLHIGLLPYASPELLSPLPPPLGPSADIWAFGVLVFTMIVGSLPFQHPYEPRLRAMITAGKYDRSQLKQAALMEWMIDEATSESSSLVNMTRKADVEQLKQDWSECNRSEFEWFYDLVDGCLQRDITRRWDLHTIEEVLEEQA